MQSLVLFLILILYLYLLPVPVFAPTTPSPKSSTPSQGTPHSTQAFPLVRQPNTQRAPENDENHIEQAKERVVEFSDTVVHVRTAVFDEAREYVVYGLNRRICE
jgi:hypothetical protein